MLLTKITQENPGSAFLVDTSSLTPQNCHSLTRDLYSEGYTGLMQLPRGTLEDYHHFLQEIHRFIANRDYRTFILDEVLTEARTYFRILNCQCTNIEEVAVALNGCDNPKQMQKGDRRVRELRRVVNDLFGIITACRCKDPRIGFSDKERRIYSSFLTYARSHSEDLKEKAIRERADLESPCNLGVQLETDQKLAATAFTLAYRAPVVVISRDNGIEKLLVRIGKGGTIRRERENFSLPILPPHRIRFENIARQI